MEHLPYEVICKIADNDILQSEKDLYLDHINICQYCQNEIRLQRSLITASHKSRLVHPTGNFTRNVMNTILPDRKKKWAEWLLHNMGNIFAMVLVLTFIVFIFSKTESGKITSNDNTKFKPATELIKVIQFSTNQISNFILSKCSINGSSTIQINTFLYALIAIIILLFIDKIAGYFFRQYNFKL